MEQKKVWMIVHAEQQIFVMVILQYLFVQKVKPACFIKYRKHVKKIHYDFLKINKKEYKNRRGILKS